MDCIFFDYRKDVCISRCNSRTNHETLHDKDVIRRVVNSMSLQLEFPPREENYRKFTVVKSFEQANELVRIYAQKHNRLGLS